MKLKPRIKEDIKKFLIQKEKEEKQKAKVVSSQRLTQEEWNEVFGLFPDLKGKKIENIVDENLIAGVVVRQGSKIVDLSLRTRLKEFKKIAYEIY